MCQITSRNCVLPILVPTNLFVARDYMSTSRMMHNVRIQTCSEPVLYDQHELDGGSAAIDTVRVCKYRDWYCALL